jgi:hypothetical protein
MVIKLSVATDLKTAVFRRKISVFILKNKEILFYIGQKQISFENRICTINDQIMRDDDIHGVTGIKY